MTSAQRWWFSEKIIIVIIGGVFTLGTGCLQVWGIKIAQSTHTLVNSEKGASLQSLELSLRRMKDYTKDPSDIEAWQEARAKLDRHIKQQAIVDRGDD